MHVQKVRDMTHHLTPFHLERIAKPPSQQYSAALERCRHWQVCKAALAGQLRSALLQTRPLAYPNDSVPVQRFRASRVQIFKKYFSVQTYSKLLIYGRETQIKDLALLVHNFKFHAGNQQSSGRPVLLAKWLVSLTSD